MIIPFGLHRWRGESGRKYWFNITLTHKGLPDEPGIYVFVRRRFHFFLEPLYVGKAASLSGRVVGHERWAEAWWDRGATERHVCRIKHERDRRRIEEDLIRGLKPKMNSVLIPRGADDAPNNARLAKRWRWRRWWNERFGWHVKV
ncbi:MAG: GIY-YIG nuclease family protein [Pseudomonadota bacterium]